MSCAGSVGRLDKCHGPTWVLESWMIELERLKETDRNKQKAKDGSLIRLMQLNWLFLKGFHPSLLSQNSQNNNVGTLISKKEIETEKRNDLRPSQSCKI